MLSPYYPFLKGHALNFVFYQRSSVFFLNTWHTFRPLYYYAQSHPMAFNALLPNNKLTDAIPNGGDLSTFHVSCLSCGALHQVNSQAGSGHVSQRAGGM